MVASTSIYQTLWPQRWREWTKKKQNSKETIDIEAKVLLLFSYWLRVYKTIWAHPKYRECVYHATHSWENCTVWEEVNEILENWWCLPIEMSGAAGGRAVEGWRLPELGALCPFHEQRFVVIFPPLTHSPQRPWDALSSGTAPSWQVRVKGVRNGNLVFQVRPSSSHQTKSS